MAQGRHTEFNEEALEKATNYLLTFVNEDGEIRDNIDRLPTIEELTFRIGVARSTVYKWHKDGVDKHFSDIFEKISQLQAMTLITNGLNGKFNSTITKLMLTKHGYKDESDVTTGGEKINDYTDEQKQRIAAEILRREQSGKSERTGTSN